MDTRQETLGETPAYFFMVSALAIYQREDQARQRHVNLLLNVPVANLTKDDLQTIQQNAMARIVAENGVEVDDIQDIIVLNISLLGFMTPSTFEGNPPVPSDPEGALTAH